MDFILSIDKGPVINRLLIHVDIHVDIAP